MGCRWNDLIRAWRGVGGGWVERSMARKAPSGGAESSLQMCRMGCEVHADAFYRQDAGPGSVLEMQCHHVAGGWRCRFHSGSRAVWGPGLCSFKAVWGSSADARMSTSLSLGLVCNCWLRWARCPEQSEVSLVKLKEPHLGTATPVPT